MKVINMISCPKYTMFYGRPMNVIEIKEEEIVFFGRTFIGKWYLCEIDGYYGWFHENNLTVV